MAVSAAARYAQLTEQERKRAVYEVKTYQVFRRRRTPNVSVHDLKKHRRARRLISLQNILLQ